MAKADIAFFISAGAVLGIGAAGLGTPLVPAFCIALIGAFAAARLRHFSSVFALILVLMFVAGHLYYHLFIAWHRAAERLPEIGESAEAAGIVRDEPRRSERALRFTLELQSPHHGRLAVVTEPLADIRFGDRLELSGRIELPEPGAHPMEPPIAVFPRITVKERGVGPWLFTQLARLRATLTGVVERALPTERGALMNGLLFGDTSGFTREFRDAMAASGTTHLTALSGYNIAILIGNVSGLCAWLLLSRRARFAVTTLFLFLFVLMVGAEASVVRAAIMGSLLMLAGEAGRTYHVRNAMTFAALGMLLLDPTLLVWSAGFLLSFLSLIGIVYLRPALAELFRMDTSREAMGLFGWRDNLLTTLAAQLMVLPVIMHYFGEFSLTALAANVLVLEFVPFTMFLGFALVGLGLVLPMIATLVATAAEIPLAYMDAVIRFFADVRIPLATGSGWGTTIVIYAALFALMVGRRMNHTRSASQQ